MARITFKNGDEYIAKISKLAIANPEYIYGPAIYGAAEIVTDKVRQNLRRNLDDPSYVGNKPDVLIKNSHDPDRVTGDLYDSLGIAKMEEKNGFVNVKIGFDGYDKNGVPNQLKARVMESGTSTINKRPFVRPAVNATRYRAVKILGQRVDEAIQKIMEDKEE